MIRRTCKRLSQANEIYRDKKPEGIFLRLKLEGARRIGGRTGKGVVIPKSWKHDCLAIQALYYMQQSFKHALSLTIETEAQLRRRQQSGKIADGTLQPKNYFFEMEYSRKSGDAMRTQSQTIARTAKEGRGCVIGYCIFGALLLSEEEYDDLPVVCSEHDKSGTPNWASVSRCKLILQ